MRKIINRLSKEEIYDYYEIIVEDSKDYDNITKFKMVEAIQEEFIFDTDIIGDIYSAEDFDNLRRDALKDADYFQFEVRLAFLYGLDEASNLVLLPFVKEYLKDTEDNLEFDHIQEFKKVFVACVGIYGHIDFNDIIDIYAKVRSPRFKNLDIPNLYEHSNFVLALQIDGYILIQGSILHPLVTSLEKPVPLSYVGHIYTLEEYLHFESQSCFTLPTGFSSSDMDFMTKVELIIEIRERMLFLQDNDEPAFLMHRLQEDIESEAIDEEEIQLFKEFLQLPVWLLGGQTGAMFLNNDHKGVIDNKYFGLFELFRDEYMLYGLKKYQKHNRSKTVEELRDSLDINEAAELLESLVNDPKFTQRFINSKSYTDHDLIHEFILAIQNPIMIDKGFSVGFTNHMLDIYHNKHVYRVSGLKQPIEQTIIQTGGFLNTILFPLENCITYGLGFQEFNIGVGEGMQQMVFREAKDAVVVENLSDLIADYKLSNVKLN